MVFVEYYGQPLMVGPMPVPFIHGTYVCVHACVCVLFVCVCMHVCIYVHWNLSIGRVLSSGGGGGEASPPKCSASPPPKTFCNN